MKNLLSNKNTHLKGKIYCLTSSFAIYKIIIKKFKEVFDNLLEFFEIFLNVLDRFFAFSNHFFLDRSFFHNYISHLSSYFFRRFITNIIEL